MRNIKHYLQTLRILAFKRLVVAPFINKKMKSSHKATDRNTVMLFADPRGGSTWLANILCESNNAFLIDEPLWRGFFNVTGNMPKKGVGKIEKLDKLNFYFHQPIGINEEWPQAEEFFLSLLGLREKSPYIYLSNNCKAFSNANWYVFKFNYGKLLIHWLTDKFRVPTIVLIRHPCAVVSSQLAFSAFNEVKTTKEFILPKFRNRSVYLTHKPLIDSLKSAEEVLAFIWGLGYLQTIAHPGNNIKWLTISYEKLYLNREAELKRIFSWLRRPFPESALGVSYLPSHQSGDTKGTTGSNSHLHAWKNQLSKQQIDNIFGVLNQMGIKAYTQSIEPNYETIFNQSK